MLLSRMRTIQRFSLWRQQPASAVISLFEDGPMEKTRLVGHIIASRTGQKPEEF